MRGSWAGGALLWLALPVGCKQDAPQDKAVTSASASALPALASAAPKPAPCRAIRVKGDARSEQGPVVTMTPLDGRSWLTLADGADVVVRHGVSSREFSLLGPGRFQPCRGGTEAVLVSAGRVKSSSGTGVRPGADFSIATPLGYLSYGDADLESTVEPSRWQIDVRRGDATTLAVPGANGLPAGPISGPNGHATVSGTPDPLALVANCQHAAREAAEGAERVLSAPDRAALGKVAALQLGARRKARGACASAEASLDREQDDVRKSRLKDQIIAAERLWRTIPLR
jgi:hypothetical protein